MSMLREILHDFMWLLRDSRMLRWIAYVAVASVAVLTVDYAGGSWEEQAGTVIQTSFQPATTGTALGGTSSGDGGATVLVTSTREERIVAVDLGTEVVEAEAGRDAFWRLEPGQTVTVRVRRGLLGGAYGWRVVD